LFDVQVIDTILYAGLYGDANSYGVCNTLSTNNIFLLFFAFLYILVTVQARSLICIPLSPST